MNAYLRPARRDDEAALRQLLSLPEVFEFLSDGAPPPPEIVQDWISAAVAGDPPFGLWLLTDDASDVLAGLVRLSAIENQPGAAELTYVVHPDHWGAGYATRMSQAVIALAFESTACEAIVAGADTPNHRSIAVMERLGMEFLRTVAYPAGSGVEWILRRGVGMSLADAKLLPIRD